MKFTKEEAIKELVAKLTANGEKLNVSQRSIDEQVEHLLKIAANDETELTAFIELTLPLIKTVDANVRNDVSAAVKTIKETKHETKEHKETELDSMKAELEEVKALFNAQKEQQRVSSIKANMKKSLKEKGVTDESFINDLLDEVTVTQDFNEGEKVEKLVSLYNKYKAEGGQETPKASQKKEEDLHKEMEDLKALREKRLKEEGIIN